MAKQKRAKGRYFLAATGFALSLALSGVGLAVSLGKGGDSGVHVSRKLAEAETRIAAQDFNGAIPLLENVLRSSPREVKGLHLLGHSHRALGEYEAALDYYVRALAIEPMHVGVNEYLGELHLEMGDLAGAEERLLMLMKACKGCAAQIDLERKIHDYRRKHES